MDAEAFEVPVPVAVKGLNLLDRVDYEDAYSIQTSINQSAEAWMRGLIAGAPRWFQVPWVSVGKLVLGAQFGSFTKPDHVLGFKVLADQPDAFAVGLESTGGLSVRLITLTTPGEATFATLIRLDGIRAQTLWPAIRRGHRYFAPYLLTRAANGLARV